MFNLGNLVYNLLNISYDVHVVIYKLLLNA